MNKIDIDKCNEQNDKLVHHLIKYDELQCEFLNEKIDEQNRDQDLIDGVNGFNKLNTLELE